MEDMFGVGGLAAAGASGEYDGLVGARGQHAPVGVLGDGVDVRWHVFLFTPTEHLNHLERGKELFFVVWIFYTFDNNLENKNNFTTYLKESCW